MSASPSLPAATSSSSSSTSSTSNSANSKYGYALNFDWKHPWPRAPVPTNEEKRLEELQKYKILESEQDEKFDKLCRIACKEMKCPIAAISFIDKQKQWFKANNGLTQKQIPRDVALCAHTIMHPKRALVVEDTSADERFKNNPLVTRASAVRFYAGVPITTPNGFCIGSVFVFDVKSHQNADPRILHKIAVKCLKYMDERLKNLQNGTLPSPVPVPVSPPAPTATKTAPVPSAAMPVKAPSSESEPVPAVVKAAPKEVANEQPAGEAHKEQALASIPRPNLPPAPIATSDALVPAQPQSTSTALEVQGAQGQGLGNMGNMLMNLLARTTETQQQLAAQQGVMFETLGQHGSQLDNLGQSMAHLERRFEQVRVKQQAARSKQPQQQESPATF